MLSRNVLHSRHCQLLLLNIRQEWRCGQTPAYFKFKNFTFNYLTFTSINDRCYKWWQLENHWWLGVALETSPQVSSAAAGTIPTMAKLSNLSTLILFHIFLLSLFSSLSCESSLCMQCAIRKHQPHFLADKQTCRWHNMKYLRCLIANLVLRKLPGCI